MPYPSEHAARLVDPDRFESFRRSADELGDGIDAIFGTDDDGTELQSIRFDASRYSAQEALDWLDEHEYQPLKFSAATEPEGDAMSDIIRCTVEGEEAADLNAAAGQALERDASVMITASLYRPERVKLYTAPRLNAAGMSAVASTLRGSPLNYEHRPISDADPVQGWIRSSWVENGAIQAEIEVTGSRVLSELSQNADPGFSIEYTYPKASVECGSCGASWFDTASDCTHIPGQVVGGEVVYCETGEAFGVGCAYTHRPASESTGILARASTGEESIDVMGPALARLAIKEKDTMSDQIELTEATTAPVDAPVAEAKSDNDLSDRLAAAEAENSLLRERFVLLEAAQAKAEANARASSNRESCLKLARAGQVANVRELIILRSKAPAELDSFDKVEAFVDAIVGCCSGTGIPVGQLSDSAVLGETPVIKNDADLEARAVQLSEERSIPYSKARRMAIKEVK